MTAPIFSDLREKVVKISAGNALRPLAACRFGVDPSTPFADRGAQSVTAERGRAAS